MYSGLYGFVKNKYDCDAYSNKYNYTLLQFEATLEDTLKSVIDQDYQDWEVIIVNDGSIDTTEEIALKYGS
jgi:glycosyltransferase involved in cell wall biosynthesis